VGRFCTPLALWYLYSLLTLAFNGLLYNAIDEKPTGRSSASSWSLTGARNSPLALWGPNQYLDAHVLLCGLNYYTVTGEREGRFCTPLVVLRRTLEHEPEDGVSSVVLEAVSQYDPAAGGGKSLHHVRPRRMRRIVRVLEKPSAVVFSWHGNGCKPGELRNGINGY